MTTALAIPTTSTPDLRDLAPSTRGIAASIASPAGADVVRAERRRGDPAFASWTVAVGQRIDQHGLAGAADDVVELVQVARRRDVAAVAVDVLADPAQPDVARRRAFAHVVSALVTGDGLRLA